MVSEKAMAELRGLSAGWRDEADMQEFLALERDSVGDEDYAESCRVRARAKVKCADELDAALDKLMENRDER